MDQLRGRPAILDLDGIRPVLARLGDPQDRLPCVLVGGTNGKGSTAAFLVSVLRAAGYRTGFFSSPAFGEERQQIQVDGEALTKEELGELLLRVVTLAETANPGRITPFEALTATAFTAFASLGMEVAVVEVGMGGERDCTNVISLPRASAVVSVGLDHRQHLGPSLARIAAEKAGIFRRDRPAVIGWLDDEAEEVVVDRARRAGSRVVLARRAVARLASVPAGRKQQDLELRTHHGDLQRARIRLPGAHQARNASLAVLLAQELACDGFERLDGATIQSGLEACRWPGRLEWMEGGRRPVLLDVAHNAEAVASLVCYLSAERIRPDLVFGCFADKDYPSMLARLLPRVG
ncbi:MAG: hypothetical protein MI919_15675, partial [Holophagales bacterium]|nr:hypothetical protein [Holophagales bacterium]